jgi:hypothetical protein
VNLGLGGLDARFACSVSASLNSYKQTAAHADGLLMTMRKTVVIGGFEKPAKAVFACRPEHEVTGNLTSY